MVKHWDLYKNEIFMLYITNGRPLKDVRRILRGRHNFDASIRAYRMKLEEWGMKKNKSPANLGKKVRLSTTTTRSRSHFRAQSTNPSGLHLGNNSVINLPSTSTLQFHDQETGQPPFDLSGSQGPSFNSSSPAVLGNFYHNPDEQIIDAAQVDGFASQQSLFEAISNSAEEELKNWLSSGVAVNVRDESNNSPLHAAVIKGNKAMIKSLLNYGADIDAIGFRGRPPLHLAVSSISSFQVLLRHQPTLSIQDDDGNTTLHHLLNIQNWWDNVDVRRMISLILSCGADVNIRNKHGECALHRVVLDAIPKELSYMEIALEFLNHDPNVLLPMRNGPTLLAVFLDSTEILSKDHTQSYGLPPWAIKAHECLEKFLVAGADPNTTVHSKPIIVEWLSNGVWEEKGSSIKALVKLIEMADIEVAGKGGNHPLHLCLKRSTFVWQTTNWRYGNYAVATALISWNANVNQMNDAGASPLEIWFENSNRHEFEKVALLLVEAGAETTKPLSTGETFFDKLSHLSIAECTRMTKVFLKADIKLHQQDVGITASGDWVEIWRSAWRQPFWHLAKRRLSDLQYTPSRPKSREFMECASFVVMEHMLEVHQSRLKLWMKGELDKDSVVENCEDYCSILKDCRDRKIDVDVSWYTFLLDLLDFK